MAYLFVLLASAATIGVMVLSVISGAPLHTAFTSAAPITQVLVVAIALHGALVLGYVGARAFGPPWQDRSRLLPALGLVAVGLAVAALSPEAFGLLSALDLTNVLAATPVLMRAALPLALGSAVAAIALAASAPGATARATRWR